MSFWVFLYALGDSHENSFSKNFSSLLCMRIKRVKSPLKFSWTMIFIRLWKRVETTISHVFLKDRPAEASWACIEQAWQSPLDGNSSKYLRYLTFINWVFIGFLKHKRLQEWQVSWRRRLLRTSTSLSLSPLSEGGRKGSTYLDT